MLEVRYTNQFKKDYKLLKKRGYDLEKLRRVVKIICENKRLPEKYKVHPLTGDYIRI